jgi:hypothetical protein
MRWTSIDKRRAVVNCKMSVLANFPDYQLLRPRAMLEPNPAPEALTEKVVDLVVS